MFFFLLCIVVSRFRNACVMGDFLCYSIICGSSVQLQCIDKGCFFPSWISRARSECNSREYYWRFVDSSLRCYNAYIAIPARLSSKK